MYSCNNLLNRLLYIDQREALFYLEGGEQGFILDHEGKPGISPRMQRNTRTKRINNPAIRRVATYTAIHFTAIHYTTLHYTAEKQKEYYVYNYFHQRWSYPECQPVRMYIYIHMT